MHSCDYHPIWKPVKTNLTLPKAPRKAFSFAERYLVYRRAKCRCVYCGAKLRPHYPHGRPLAFDHVHPLARGGADDVSNLAASCAPCNQSKQAKTLFEFTCAEMGIEITGLVRFDERLVALADDDEFFIDRGAFDWASRDHSLDYDDLDEYDLGDDFCDPYMVEMQSGLDEVALS